MQMRCTETIQIPTEIAKEIIIVGSLIKIVVSLGPDVNLNTAVTTAMVMDMVCITVPGNQPRTEKRKVGTIGLKIIGKVQVVEVVMENRIKNEHSGISVSMLFVNNKFV